MSLDLQVWRRMYEQLRQSQGNDMGVIWKAEHERYNRVISRLPKPPPSSVELVRREGPNDTGRPYKIYALVHETLLGSRIVISEMTMEELGKLNEDIGIELSARQLEE